MSDGRIRPPWDQATVDGLNRWQARRDFHPFTCGNGDGGELVAQADGWHCPLCDYRQDWAWGFMATYSPPL